MKGGGMRGTLPKKLVPGGKKRKVPGPPTFSTPGSRKKMPRGRS